jgi:hypothetical protein
MSRVKKPEFETPEQATVRNIFEAVSNHATRSEKTAWERKRNNMEKLVKLLRPLEDKIMEIRAKMQPTYDEISELRVVMTEECIHPYDMLVYNEITETVTCKFCEKTMKPVSEEERVNVTALEEGSDGRHKEV